MDAFFEIEDVKEVVELLEKEKIGYVVVGGWGWDGMTGKITRKHSDLDLICRVKPGRVIKALRGINYGKVREFNDLLEFRKGNKKIDLGIAVKHDDYYLMNGKYDKIRLSKKDFENAGLNNLDGTVFRTAPVSVLYSWEETSKK